MRDGCLGGGWWVFGRDGRVLGRGEWVLERRRGLGVLTQHVEKSGKKWKAREVYLVRDTAQGSRRSLSCQRYRARQPEKFILSEIPRKAAGEVYLVRDTAQGSRRS